MGILFLYVKLGWSIMFVYNYTLFCITINIFDLAVLKNFFDILQKPKNPISIWRISCYSFFVFSLCSYLTSSSLEEETFSVTESVTFLLAVWLPLLHKCFMYRYHNCFFLLFLPIFFYYFYLSEVVLSICLLVKGVVSHE